MNEKAPSVSKPARFGHLIEEFIRAGASREDIQEASASFAALPALAHHQVLAWSLTVDGKKQTFAPGQDRLLHPLALGGLIENNRDGQSPSKVIVEVTMVGGSSRQVTTWPPRHTDKVALLESLTELPGAPGGPDADGSDWTVHVLNLGSFGKVCALFEHDRDPSRRWHRPRARIQTRTRTGAKGVLVGWWDWSVNLRWVPGGNTP